jgi:hypothetical protein
MLVAYYHFHSVSSDLNLKDVAGFSFWKIFRIGDVSNEDYDNSNVQL